MGKKISLTWLVKNMVFGEIFRRGIQISVASDSYIP